MCVRSYCVAVIVVIVILPATGNSTCVDNYRRNLRVVLCVDIRVVIAQLLYTVTRRIICGQLRA